LIHVTGTYPTWNLTVSPKALRITINELLIKDNTESPVSEKTFTLGSSVKRLHWMTRASSFSDFKRRVVTEMVFKKTKDRQEVDETLEFLMAEFTPSAGT
jgi:hypothetical protein